jgi:hypothetical protein
MGAYAVKLSKPKCSRCDKWATKEVFNTRNASCGYYCEKHARAMLRKLNEE